jgi:hypothetical protein
MKKNFHKVIDIFAEDKNISIKERRIKLNVYLSNYRYNKDEYWLERAELLLSSIILLLNELKKNNQLSNLNIPNYQNINNSTKMVELIKEFLSFDKLRKLYFYILNLNENSTTNIDLIMLKEYFIKLDKNILNNKNIIKDETIRQHGFAVEFLNI